MDEIRGIVWRSIPMVVTPEGARKQSEQRRVTQCRLERAHGNLHDDNAARWDEWLWIGRTNDNVDVIDGPRFHGQPGQSLRVEV